MRHLIIEVEIVALMIVDPEDACALLGEAVVVSAHKDPRLLGSMASIEDVA